MRLNAVPALGGALAAVWLGLAFLRGRFWDLRPLAEDEPPPPSPSRWPSVSVVVPARNEAALLPRTLPALRGQDYAGELSLLVVDDRSEDGTGALAAQHGAQVVRIDALPAGWAGKVWAMHRGVQAAPAADYVLLTDADILHAPASLRHLVAESESDGLALNSRMACLHVNSPAERLLMPAFLFFFNLLYPMRLVNGPGRLAAAAGGCILVRRSALDAARGFESFRGALIDDVSLARAVKGSGGRIRLSLSRSDVVSLREYGSLGPIWRMVSRTAFEQLRHSWLLLAGTLAGLAFTFLGPPVVVVLGLRRRSPVAAGLGAAAWALMAGLYLPTVRYYRLPRRWALTLPVAAAFYGAMTADSAVRHAAGWRGRW